MLQEASQNGVCKSKSTYSYIRDKSVKKEKCNKNSATLPLLPTTAVTTKRNTKQDEQVKNLLFRCFKIF